MDLHGLNIIAGERAHAEGQTLRAFNPSLGEHLEPPFYEATPEQIDRAMQSAALAFQQYRRQSPEEIASLLEKIAEQIDALGDELIDRANSETGLPDKRLRGERVRTVNQLRMFADVVKEGSWVEACIDRAQPERKPLPKPDVRRMLIPIGPVVVFGASNFPFAFSVAGGDTASALAAGNPVVVKAHPAHPGTSEMVARAIAQAIDQCHMPAGLFSLLHGTSHEVSLALVRHPLTKAVGFTGSLKAGRALFDVAANRPEPIPVYAEMGSVNPIFVLPGAMKERGETFAEGLQQSVTLGVGQFCTSPGLVVGLADAGMNRFVDKINELMRTSQPATMLYPGIRQTYEDGLRRLEKVSGVRVERSDSLPTAAKTEGQPTVFNTDAETFLKNPQLGEEVFGPSTVIVSCHSRRDFEEVARSLHGHLTATIHGTPEDLREYKELIPMLEDKVGRLIFNDFPTGVEVCAAMQHGGPYPATTDSRSTSVGTAAIKRFARPICYQNFPQEALPFELRDDNRRGIWRTIDNHLTKDDRES